MDIELIIGFALGTIISEFTILIGILALIQKLNKKTHIYNGLTANNDDISEKHTEDKSTADNNNTFENQSNNISDIDLPSAKKAYESTTIPQLQTVVRDINDARRYGRTKTSTCNDEKLQHITISVLLAKGYDVHISYFKSTKSFSNSISFDDTASGKLTFNNAEAKQMINYPENSKNNFDIIDD